MADLVHAARVAQREAAQIHEHYVTLLHKTRKDRLPCIGTTEEIIDAEPAVTVGRPVEQRESRLEGACIADEMTSEPPGHEVEQLMRLGRALGEIGSGNQLHAAD